MFLRLGRITYANCEPFFHFLRDAGFAGEIIAGVPAELNRLLAAAELDVSPSSSFEYARNWRNYHLYPDMSISSDGAVQSVLCFGATSLSELDPAGEIIISGESATSVNLLSIMLQEYCGWERVRLRLPQRPIGDCVEQGESVLVIGDLALQLRNRADRPFVDLGAAWKSFTGLPFVFALWIVHDRAVADMPQELESLRLQLLESRRLTFDRLAEVARRVSRPVSLSPEQLCAYWKKMEYGLEPAALAGLRLYFRLACKYGLLADEPELRFTGA